MASEGVAAAGTDGAVLQATDRWLQRAVIGLNLCPFARAVQARGQLRHAVSAARTPIQLEADLRAELLRLHEADAELHDTTLLIAPHLPGDFLDFNDFLDRADAVVRALGLEGEFQIASFHPRYRFAGTAEDDVTNCTNRAPYPTLHLLREASVDRAVAAFPDASMIFGRNMQTLERLGIDGWTRLLADDTHDAPHPAARPDRSASR